MGAFYRSALAQELSERGYTINSGTGKEGRYFEIAGVPDGLTEAFSARSATRRAASGSATRASTMSLSDEPVGVRSRSQAVCS